MLDSNFNTLYDELAEYLEPRTADEKMGQLVFSLIMNDLGRNAKQNVKRCKAETRRLLERVRDGAATDEERRVIVWAVRHLSKEREVAKNSAYARQTYALTLKYLAPELLEVREIAQLFNVDVATTYRDISSAIERLAFWLFGVEALDWK